MPGAGFWQELTSAERDALSALGRTSVFPSGRPLCIEGEPATHLFVLVSGLVKVTVATRDGEERVLALRGNGAVVGELANATAGHRTATMRAAGRVDALIVAHDVFASFLAAHPNANQVYLLAVTQRWGEAANMLLAHTTTSGPQRFARMLLDLAGLHGVAVGASLRMEMPLSQAELASLAGVSRATATRAFTLWRKRGLVQTGRRSIVISDVDALRKIAARLCSGAGVGEQVGERLLDGRP
jgi:CRP/FNR family transcriptional regulator, cyclic AMP receptor protein